MPFERSSKASALTALLALLILIIGSIGIGSLPSTLRQQQQQQQLNSFAGITSAYAQQKEGEEETVEANNNTTTTTLQYIQNAKQLLKQASIEYQKGNTTGADTLSTTAYLDNFEYVEPVLIQHNAIDLKEQTEQMMRVQLREMIKSNAAADQIDSQINAIIQKLDQAATLLKTS